MIKTLRSLRIVGLLLIVAVIALVAIGHIPAWAAIMTPWVLVTVAGASTLAVTSTTNRFQNTPCSVVVSNNYDTVGTVTRATIAHLTPSQLEDIFRPSGLFGDMDAWFRTSFEMKACGTKVNGLYDWVYSSQRDVGALKSFQKLDRGPSLLMPFIMARQDSVINNEFWAISCGCIKSSYTSGATACTNGTSMAGPLTAGDLALGANGDRVIRVITRYGVDLDSKWFLNRDRIIIFGRSGGQQTHGQWKVLASEVAADNSYVDVLITSQNSGSTPYDAAPTAGVIISNGPYVNDFESWCNNRPTIDPRKRVPFWVETVRKHRAVDSEYKKVFARLMESNAYFQAFGDLPLSERNRQDEVFFQKQRLNAFFWGKAVSANQTLANWQSLRQILTVTGSQVDPGLGGKIVAYEAYQVGVVEQLRQCGRVFDLRNNALNLYEFLDDAYAVHRARKSQGKRADSLDYWTDSRYAANFETGFINYMKNEYGDIVRLIIKEGSNETLGFKWKSYSPKFPQGVEINIITHEYFDDFQNAFETESIGSSGRMMLGLDMGKSGPNGGTVYPGMIASNSKQRTLGELENLARIDPTFACTMEFITEDIMLHSETQTAIVECPANSSVVLGIADTPPIVTGKSTNPTYTNLY